MGRNSRNSPVSGRVWVRVSVSYFEKTKNRYYSKSRVECRVLPFHLALFADTAGRRESGESTKNFVWLPTPWPWLWLNFIRRTMWDHGPWHRPATRLIQESYKWGMWMSNGPKVNHISFFRVQTSMSAKIHKDGDTYSLPWWEYEIGKLSRPRFHLQQSQFTTIKCESHKLKFCL
jgi:hypothetical protein